MPEETAASSSVSMEEKPCSSSAVLSSVDVMEEAKKLIGTGKRHLVMGDVVSAVNVFQEACGMLAARYGDTADECGEAFFLCGKSLLELARMENTVLGNALEGVPEESSEEGEKQDNPNIESADNLDEKTRDELRMQVYDAMAEKDTCGAGAKTEAQEEEGETKTEKEGTASSAVKNGLEKSEAPVNGVEKSPASGGEAVKENGSEEPKGNGSEEPKGNGEAEEEKMEVETNEAVASGEESVKEAGSEEQKGEEAVVEKSPASGEEAVKENGSEEQKGNDETEKEKMETNETGEEEGDDDDDDDDDDAEEGNAEDKESEEEEVGNLQLAWEMLEVAKVIFKRKASVEDQLMAAQAYLKLGEVSAESGNYSQALEDFQDCLTLQLKHLPPHNRLLAETHYQLGMTLCYTGLYNQAVQHYGSSIKVIESRLAMLQEVIDKAEGEEGAKEERSELEELKLLLPDISEKVEDAKESQRTASTASQAIQQTLGGASTSSAFPGENGGPSSSTAFAASQIPVRPSDGASSSTSASDISHLVRKKRKPEEESPKKDTDAKKAKQETTVNGSGESASNGNGVQEKEAQEPVKPSASVESSA